MKPTALDVLVCPGCKGDLDVDATVVEGREILDGSLTCLSCHTHYPIRGGVARFVPDGKYASSFGRQWHWFSTVQLDSATGTLCRASGVKGAEIFGVDLTSAVDTAYRNIGRPEGVRSGSCGHCPRAPWRFTTCIVSPVLGTIANLALPISMERHWRWRWLDTFDWYTPKYQFNDLCPEIFRWYQHAGFDQLEIFEDPVRMSGQKRSMTEESDGRQRWRDLVAS